MSAADLLQLLLTFKYGALFILVIVEGFFSTIAAGSLSATHIMNIFIALPVVVAADMFGDYLYYTFGKRLVRSRFAHWFGLSQKRVVEVEALYKKRGPSIIILAKLSSYLAIPVIIAAGAIHMHKRRFYSYCLAAAVIKASVLLLLGYFFGKSIHDLTHAAIVVSIGLTITLAMYWYGSHALRRAKSRRIR
jgi:membrane-associated protein